MGETYEDYTELTAQQAIQEWEDQKLNEAHPSLPDQLNSPLPAPVRPEHRTVRAAIFDVVDGGWQCSHGCDIKHPWHFDPYDEGETETAHRQRFANAVLERVATIQRAGLARVQESEVGGMRNKDTRHSIV